MEGEGKDAAGQVRRTDLEPGRGGGKTALPLLLHLPCAPASLGTNGMTRLHARALEPPGSVVRFPTGAASRLQFGMFLEVLPHLLHVRGHSPRMGLGRSRRQPAGTRQHNQESDHTGADASRIMEPPSSAGPLRQAPEPGRWNYSTAPVAPATGAYPTRPFSILPSTGSATPIGCNNERTRCRTPGASSLRK